MLNNTGVQLYFFEVQRVTALKLFFHFGIALFQVGICGYWAHLLRQRTLRVGNQPAENRPRARALKALRRHRLVAVGTDPIVRRDKCPAMRAHAARFHLDLF